MIRLSETIHVPRSPRDCFRYVSDFSTIEQWDPGVYRATKLTDGAPGRKSQFNLELSIPGRTVNMDYTITHFEPDTRLELIGVGPDFEAYDVIEFRSTGEQTEITYEAELTFKGLMGTTEKVMKPWLNSVGKKAVAGLRRALTPQRTLESIGALDTLKQKAILPAAWDFTERGYLNMPDKGLSTFIDGQVALVTGPTSGLGLATACELARLGARLILLGRTPAKLERAVEEIRAFSGCDREMIDIVEADLLELSNVREAAHRVLDSCDRLDIVIHNAGALFDERRETVDGVERSMAINLVSPFVLTRELMPLIEASASRVIAVSSGGMYTQALHLDDMGFEDEKFDGAKAYARAKRGLVAVMDHWAKTQTSSGATFNSMHPGWADTPGVKSSLPLFHKTLKSKLRDSRMGADTIVWMATSGAVADVSGKFFFDRKPRAKSIVSGTRVDPADSEALLRWLTEASDMPPQH